MLFVKFVALVRMSTQQFLRNNCAHMAAAISYYALFSLFPLALALVSIVGFWVDTPDEQSRFAESVGSMAPVSKSLIASTLEGVVRTRGATGILAILGLLWAGTTVFAAIRKAVNYSFGITVPRPFLKERLMDLGLLIGASVAMLASVAITASFGELRRLGHETLVPLVSSDFFWDWGVSILFPWALSSITFLLLYRYLPNTRVDWPYLAFGALVGSIGFEGAKHIFVWYVHHYSTYSLVYGSLSTVVAFLTWSYISAFLLLVGGQVASVLPKVVGPEAIQLPEERALRSLQELRRLRSLDKSAGSEGAGQSGVMLGADQAQRSVKAILSTLFQEWVTEAADRTLVRR